VPASSSPPASKGRARGHSLINAGIHAGRDWVARYGAIGPDDSGARRFGHFGPGSCLAFPPGALFGQRWISIGNDTLVGPHVSISAGMVPGQSMVTDPVVRIGDRCMIGRGSHIVGHFQLEIGDDVHTGPYVYITDQNHGYEDPDQVVHAQWPSDVPVLIGNGSWLGTGVVILPGTRLGKNVVVGAGAVVRGTFPDHCVVAGVPARVVRRYDPGSGWVPGTDFTGSPSPSRPSCGSGGPSGTGTGEDPVGSEGTDPSDAEGVVASSRGTGRPSP
jgi:acetyltransferase-like isoleucine patch superfamily enzyme